MPDINRLRILVTGFREWADIIAVAQAMRWALSEYGAALVRTGDYGAPCSSWGQVGVVHGATRGADTLADRIATGWGIRVERHPVRRCDWESCTPHCDPAHRRKGFRGSTYCPAAANHRNQRMVDLGADVCLAFPSPAAWSGTRDCMQRAERAGIRVVDWPRHDHSPDPQPGVSAQHEETGMQHIIGIAGTTD
jgi:CDGSH-type Zn-finger protein